MPFIEDVLPKTLRFDFKAVGKEDKWGVYEQVQKEDVLLNVGCVFIGSAPECRAYVSERNARQELRAEEQRGRNPLLDQFDRKYRNPRRDGVVGMVTYG